MKLPRIWPAAASGLLVVATFPPFRLVLLVFVALVPWLIYLRDSDGKRAFRSGILFGLIFWLGEFSFVAQFVGNWTGSLALGLVPYLLGCMIGSLYFGFFGWLAHLCYRNRWIWAIPFSWAGVEVFRSYVIGLAFPFGLLASPLTPLPALIQSAHYGSIYFTSAWLVLGSVVVAELLQGTRYVAVRGAALVFVGILGLSVARYSNEPSGEFRHVAVGQPGVDMAFGERDGRDARLAGPIERIIDRARGSDLLVLPEGLVHGSEALPPPTPFRVDPALPILFGGQRGDKPAHQSAFAFDGHWQVADKTRLVIFGEYVPFRKHLPFLDSFNLPGGDLEPGERLTTLAVGKFKVGASLCFEGLFPDVSYRHARNGANLLAVMSIDDWYFGTNAPEQLRDAANWRAVETGLPVARAASLGYTIIVDARGRTVAEAPPSSEQMLGAAVRVPAEPDLFPLFPVFPYASLASLALIPIASAARRRGGAAG